MTWDDALNDTLLDYRGVEYTLGERDCVHFVAAYLGRAGQPVELPEYGRLEAARLLRGEFSDLIGDRLGEPTIPAEPGAPVLVNHNGHEFPGVYNGAFVIAFTETAGLCNVDASFITSSWSPPNG